MAITPANFQVFVTNVNTMIGAVYNEDYVESVYSKICTPYSCSTSQMTFGWTGLLPKMRAWYGARHVNQAAPQTYTVEMIPYENTLSIDRFNLDDDQMGIYYRQLPDLARQARRQPDYEVRDLIEASGVQGTTVRQSGLDGLSFWSTSHPVDLYDATKGTYINDFVGGQTVDGTTVGGALTPTALTSLMAYMMTLRGEDNERLGIRPNVLMHPPTMFDTVSYILKAQFLAPPTWGSFAPVTGQVGASDNVITRFGVDPLQNSFLNDNQNWYLLDLTKPVKPFAWITREATRMVPRLNESDPNVFDEHMFQWGQWNRCAPAWGFSFLAARSGPSP